MNFISTSALLIVDPEAVVKDNLGTMGLGRWIRGYRGLSASKGGSGGGGGSLVIEDEGNELGTATRMNFVGAGIAAATDGTTATVAVPGATLAVSDEGVSQGAAAALNIVGAGASIAVSMGVATLTIPGGGGGSGNSYMPSGW